MRESRTIGRSLAASAVGAAMLLVAAPAVTRAQDGATAGRSECHRNAPPIIRDGFPQPPMRYSRNGVLETRLRASVGPVRINHERVVAMNYEGSFPGPTLVVCPGDRMVVHFENDLAEPTNLHTHGFHVSPRANHDNVYLELAPGERFTYEYRLPKDHPPGAYWYHPHRHMLVEPQIFGGLSGAIVVGGGLDRVRGLRRVPQRWMVIQSTEVRDGRVLPVEQSNEEHTPLHINGVVNPTVEIRPGQVQRWRLFNANDNRIVVLRLGGRKMWVLAEDGNTLRRPRAVRTLKIAPGSRREILVRGSRRGRYVMKAIPFAQFPGGNKAGSGGPTPDQTVLTVRSAGRPAHDRVPRGLLSRPVDLRGRPVDRRRRIVFDELPLGGDQTDFLLNGNTFDPSRVITMELGALEEWTLVNKNTEWHTGGLALVLSRVGASNTVHGNVVADVSGGGVELRGPGAGNRIEDNWVHDIGIDYRSSIGIAVEDSPNATVAHNQVNDVPYTGIWGETPGGLRVENNLVFDAVQAVPDGGGIYLPFAQGTSFDDGAVIRGNVVHHAGGTGIYPDVGADWVTLERNVLYRSDEAVAGVEPKRIRIADNHLDDDTPFWWPEDTATDGVTLAGNTLLPRANPAASCRADAACAHLLATAGRRRTHEARGPGRG